MTQRDARRQAADNSTVSEVIAASDEVGAVLSGYSAGAQLLLGLAYIAGIAEGKRQDRSRRKGKRQAAANALED